MQSCRRAAEIRAESVPPPSVEASAVGGTRTKPAAAAVAVAGSGVGLEAPQQQVRSKSPGGSPFQRILSELPRPQPPYAGDSTSQSFVNDGVGWLETPEVNAAPQRVNVRGSRVRRADYISGVV